MPAATPTSRRLAGALALPSVILTLASLAACGGGDTAAPIPMALAQTEATAGPELFDERGWPQVAAPQLVPADTAARTRLGLYASARQLAWQAQIAGPYTRVFDLDAAGSPEVLIEQARQAMARPAEGRMSYFVQAGDLRAGAALVDALADLGLADVFLLLPTSPAA